ncbi:MAG: glycine cleavage system aminomethyltransferase GcvT [Alphaproteobacteria bacterium]|nr:glycine cleavage system aminomethyltransferase GcvT [Alphaproteobacteria bacterium]
MLNDELKKLPLDAVHRASGAKFGAFAGYDMPILYPEGLMAEHGWTRSQAGLFDVSHMGPCFLTLKDAALTGDAAHAAIAAAMERLVPSDIAGLKPGQMRYSVLLNAEGGALDDLMIARPAAPERQGMLYLVVNAGCKDQDWALIEAALGDVATLTRADDRALLALQGPAAEAALEPLLPGVAAMAFMELKLIETARFGRTLVTRSGYTGEDGYEILVHPEHAGAFAAALTADARVKWIGLGARDSLRLEAGLCLYGHDLDPTISPIEADLSWIIQKRRRTAADFPGASRILEELKAGPKRKRVGIRPKDRAPAREGVEIHAGGRRIGVVTSGGFGPSVGAPISMGYVEPAFATPGTTIELLVRGQPRAAEIVSLPFAPHRYKRSAS